MSIVYRLRREMLEETFKHFRTCGRGRQECQALWVSSWDSPELIAKVIHPKHIAQGDGFVLDDRWLNEFWIQLANDNMGIRIQIHTHPQEAFHSARDDAFPIIHKPGFLSLVIPRFGLGPIGFADAYLTEIQPNGQWRQVEISSRLVLI